MTQNLLPETAALIERKDGVQGLLSRCHEVVDVSEEVTALAKSGMRVQRLLDLVADDLEIAPELIVDSPDMLAEAERIRGRLATVAADSGEIQKERKALTTPFNNVVKVINAGYNAPCDHIRGVMDGLGKKILAYHQEQQRLQAAREAEERSRREAAIREAAEKEAAAKAEAQSLIAASQEAQASGSDIAAQELAAQAGQIVDQARQVADAAILTARAAPATAPVAAASGVRGTWDCELSSLDNLIVHVAARLLGVPDGDTLRAMVPEHSLARPDRSLVSLLRLDEIVARGLAKAQKQGFNVPGLRANFKSSVSAKKVAL